jgi:hypothetical protein
MEGAIAKWLHTETPDMYTHEQEIKNLFFALEDVLRERGLLDTRYTKYRNLHFATFCQEIYGLTTVYSQYGRR